MMLYKELEVGLHSFLTWAVGGQQVVCFMLWLLKLAKEIRLQLAWDGKQDEGQNRSGAVQQKFVPLSRTEPPTSNQ